MLHLLIGETNRIAKNDECLQVFPSVIGLNMPDV